MFRTWAARKSANNARILMLSATLPEKERPKLFYSLGLKKELVDVFENYACSSEGIFVERLIRPGHSSADEFTFLQDVVDQLKTHGSSTEKCIIVCNTIATLDRVVTFFEKQLPVKGKLGRDATEPLWARFDGASTSGTTKRCIINEFKKTNSFMRVILGTTAVIMGLNMPTVARVKFIGVPREMWVLVQLLGRAGRDGCCVHFSLHWNRQDTPDKAKTGTDRAAEINEAIDEVLSCYENEKDCLLRLFEKSMGYPAGIMKGDPRSGCCSNCLAAQPSATLFSAGPFLQHSHQYQIPSQRAAVLSFVASMFPSSDSKEDLDELLNLATQGEQEVLDWQTDSDLQEMQDLLEELH